MVLEVFPDGEQGPPNVGQSGAIAGVAVVGPAAADDVVVGVAAAAVIVVEYVGGSWVAAAVVVGVAVAGTQGAEAYYLEDTADEKAILQGVVGQAPQGGGAMAGWGIALEGRLEGAWEL